ncbi:tyrosine-type recombinase/integrase [Ferrimonas balearica]|uniref:tyrosine-type recombinase/integrase n=1 Tax=Ferrimonas balearica TaxID=44012 RepID=UPI001C59A23E|nr:tyrosine-type recombinase/integrase [Ferrimonas balearica]MBW3140566.1 tyrosine-type recombinase/integrase [Ferrimonas balearica]
MSDKSNQTIPVNNTPHVTLSAPALLKKICKQADALNQTQARYDAQIQINEALAQSLSPVSAAAVSAPTLQQGLQTYLDRLESTPGHKGQPRAKSTLNKTRSRLSKIVKWLGQARSMSEIRQCDVEQVKAEMLAEKLAPKTQAHYLKEASSWFKWAIKNELVTNNPFFGSAPHVEKDDPVIFEPEQLAAVFQHPAFTSPKKAASYWIPLLALYTGARSGELCQLSVGDVVQMDGLWVLSLDDDLDGQTVKNRNARRLVPIHSKLLEFGFIEFCQAQRQRGETWLFHDLGSDAREYLSNLMSKRFGRVLDSCGIKGEKRPTMHAFRRTVATILRANGVPEQHTAELLGHDNDLGLSYTIYGGRSRNLTLLKSIIEKLDFSAETVDVMSFWTC